MYRRNSRKNSWKSELCFIDYAHEVARYRDHFFSWILLYSGDITEDREWDRMSYRRSNVMSNYPPESEWSYNTLNDYMSDWIRRAFGDMGCKETFEFIGPFVRDVEISIVEELIRNPSRLDYVGQMFTVPRPLYLLLWLDDPELVQEDLSEYVSYLKGFFVAHDSEGRLCELCSIDTGPR